MALAMLGVGGEVPELPKVEKPKPKGKPDSAKSKAKPANNEEGEDDDANADEDGEGEDDDAHNEEDGEGDDDDADNEEDGEDEDANADEDGEGEDDDADDDEDKSPRDKRRERFSKLTAKLREKDTAISEKEARIAELEEALAIKGTPKAATTPGNPLADIEDETSLNERVTLARRIQRWCQANPEGGTPPGTETEISKETVEHWLDWSYSVQDAAESHRKVLNSREQTRQTANQLYPTQFKAGHEDNKLRIKLLKEIPGLNTHPERDLIIGRLIRAAAQETQEKDGKGKFVFMPLGKKAKTPADKGSETQTPAKAKSTATPPQRARVSDPGSSPKRKLSADLDSGKPVSAEALLFGA